MRVKAKKFADRNVLVPVAFLLVVPVVAHLLFSWRGFAPVDDGFTLAYSRRILEGQVPHRDFIIIRPFLSPLLHTPFVLFGGEYTYWVSRLFVWFQFAVISWAWVSIVNRAFDNPFGTATKVFVAIVSFAASVHYFVLTAWHTVDGLFLASLGMWALAARGRAAWRVAGYLLVAAAYLCKQNFLFVAPLSVLLFGDWREKKYWLTIALPGVAYCAYLLVTGSFSEAVSQLTSQSGLASTGVGAYLNYGTLIGVAAGYGAMFLLGARFVPPTGAGRVVGYVGAAMLVAVPAAFVALGLYRGSLAAVSFGVFGMALGAVLYQVFSGAGRDEKKVPIALAALLLAWSASLSVGYNFPTLFLGPLLTLLVAFAYSAYRERGAYDFHVPELLRTALVVGGVAVLLGFGVARPYYIYREQPSGGLTEPVGEVLPGGRLIYTNPNTYAFLADLDAAAGSIAAEEKRYAIIPDVPGYWVQAEQTNPLLIDWPQPVELGDQRLMDRVTSDLAAERGEVVVLVQKVQAFDLRDGAVPLDEDQYEVVQYVRANFEKTRETEFFELYE